MPAGIIMAAAAVGSLGLAAYGVATRPSGAVSTGNGSWVDMSGVPGWQPQVRETPEERALYETQALEAESQANLDEANTEIAANNATTTATWTKNIAIIIGIFFAYQFARKKGFL